MLISITGLLDISPPILCRCFSQSWPVGWSWGWERWSSLWLSPWQQSPLSNFPLVERSCKHFWRLQRAQPHSPLSPCFQISFPGCLAASPIVSARNVEVQWWAARGVGVWNHLWDLLHQQRFCFGRWVWVLFGVDSKTAWPCIFLLPSAAKKLKSKVFLRCCKGPLPIC